MKPDADARNALGQGQTLTRKTLDDRAREDCTIVRNIRGTSFVEQCRAHGHPPSPHQRTGAVAWLCTDKVGKAN